MRSGFSLLEMVFALGLVALIVPLLLNLLPASSIALKRAEDLNAASAYGYKLIEDCRQAPLPAAGVDLSQAVTFNGTTFTAQREIFLVAGFPELRDVVVTLQGPARFAPIRVASRLGWDD